jgi:hypothetical protein
MREHSSLLCILVRRDVVISVRKVRLSARKVKVKLHGKRYSDPSLIVKSWQKRGNKMSRNIKEAKKHGAASAAQNHRVEVLPLLLAPIIIYYQMRLKTGQRLRCPILNPLIGQHTEEQRKRIIET